MKVLKRPDWINISLLPQKKFNWKEGMNHGKS